MMAPTSLPISAGQALRNFNESSSQPVAFPELRLLAIRKEMASLPDTVESLNSSSPKLGKYESGDLEESRTVSTVLKGIDKNNH